MIRSQDNAFKRFVNLDYSASLTFFLGAILALLFGVTFGLILATQFVFPDFLRGIPVAVFGRLRQAHTNTVMFAFLSMGLMATWYYLVPKLTGRKLWSELMGIIAAVLWFIAVVIGVTLLLLGYSQGREYAEMVYFVDVLVIIVAIMNLVNLYMTMSKRVEQKLFVSLWYIAGTLIWFPMLYFIGNVMWVFPQGALTGINDSIFNWFYGHNVLGLFFTTGLLPSIYFITARETHTPLFSHYLGLIAFWGIAFFYTGLGGHHLEWVPIPYWVKTIAIADSIGMVLVVVAFMANIWLTLRGSWNKVFTSIPLRFIVIGFVAYILVSYQGSHEALRGINLLTHYTQYVPSHAHLSLLFFSGTTIIGAAYYMIPKMFNIQIWSKVLANVQFVVFVVGFFTFFMGFLLAGITQGSSWVHIGLPVWTTLPGLRPYMLLRLAGGIPLWGSFVLFAINIIGTLIVRRPAAEPEGAVDLPIKGPAPEQGLEPATE